MSSSQYQAFQLEAMNKRIEPYKEIFLEAYARSGRSPTLSSNPRGEYIVRAVSSSLDPKVILIETVTAEEIPLFRVSEWHFLTLTVDYLLKQNREIRTVLANHITRLGENFEQAFAFGAIEQSDSWVFDEEAWTVSRDILDNELSKRGIKLDVHAFWERGRRNMWVLANEEGNMPDLPEAFYGQYEDLARYLVMGLQAYTDDRLVAWARGYQMAGYSDARILEIMREQSNKAWLKGLALLNNPHGEPTPTTNTDDIPF